MSEQLWHDTDTVQGAIRTHAPDWLQGAIPHQTAFAALDPEAIFIHGSAFGAGHLGVEQWMDPRVGFCIRAESVRDRCSAALAQSPNGVRVYLFMDKALMNITFADYGLAPTLREPTRVHTVGAGQHVFAVEAFTSTSWGSPLTRLRNLHTFAP